MASFNWPPQGGGGGLTKVADANARNALNPADGDVVIQLDNDTLYAWDATTMSWLVVGGSGTVQGPVSSTDNAIARFDTTTGTLIQNSNALLNDAGTVSLPTNQGLENTVAGSTLNFGTVNSDVINIGGAASTVNVIGTLATIHTTDLQVSDNLISLNHDGTDVLAQTAGIQIEGTGNVIVGYIKGADTGNVWSFNAASRTGIFNIDTGSANFVTTLQPTTLTANRTFTLPDATGTLALTSDLSAYVLKSGDTMTGPLVLSADPSVALGAATKQYVDTKVAKAGDTMTGALIINIASNQIILSSGINQLTLSSGSSTAARTYTVPDVGTTAQFVMTQGAQTINGVKTYSSPIVADITGNAATVTTNADLSGDITSVGNVTTIANVVTAGTNTKITYNAKGQVTAGTTLAAADIPNLDFAKITTGIVPTSQGGTGVNSTLVFPTAGTVVIEGGREVTSMRTDATTTVTILITDSVVRLTNTAARTVTLPTTPPNGFEVTLKDSARNALSFNITINAGGSDTIEGNASLVIDSDNEAVRLKYSLTGTMWERI